jgi:hypothetical protein
MTRANMQITKEKQDRTRSPPMGEIHGLLLPVARARKVDNPSAGGENQERESQPPGGGGGSPRPAPLTLPEEGAGQTPVQSCLGERGEVGLGKREEFGEHSCPGEQEGGQSLSFQSPAPWPGGSRLVQHAMSSFLDTNLWLGQRKGRLTLPSPHYPLHVPGPCQRESHSGEQSAESDCPTALRLRLLPGRGGPARGGVGETIGNAGEGRKRGRNEGRGLLTYSRFSCPF